MGSHKVIILIRNGWCPFRATGPSQLHSTCPFSVKYSIITGSCFIYLDKIGNKNNLHYVFKFVKLCIFSRLLAKVRNILVTCLSWNISINISWIYLMFEVAHRWWAKYFPTFNYFFKYMYIIFCVADSNVQRFAHGHIECLIFPSSNKILAMLFVSHT